MPFRTALYLTDQTFGAWTVLHRTPRPAHISPTDHHTYWLCQCVCGTQAPVVGVSLSNGRSHGCQTCANKINCQPGVPRPNSWGKKDRKRSPS